jgi:hypothetical protein
MIASRLLRRPRPARRYALALASPLVLAGGMLGTGSPSAAASACATWSGLQPVSPGTGDDQLNSVTVLSPCNAWAVGDSGIQTLIEHFNGASWKVIASPITLGTLTGVRARSASDVWAVGSYPALGRSNTLILHWNGHGWKQVASPDPGSSSSLAAVRVTTRSNAWAVGRFTSDGAIKTLVLHWNGRSWTKQTSPSPGQRNLLNAVAATSASNAWAAGTLVKGGKTQTLTLHWNGHSWKQVHSPDPSADAFLNGLGASSATNVWAAGGYFKSGTNRTLLLHWNGHAWKQVRSPNLGGAPGRDTLGGVTVISGTNAWAAGGYDTGAAPEHALVLHWDGHRWKSVTAPHVGVGSELLAVSASARTNLWAVGDSSDGIRQLAFAVHCC